MIFLSFTFFIYIVCLDQQYEESYDAYEAAYDWLTDQQVHQSDLLVALASMALLFQKHEDAKQLLLKSTLLKPPSPWALYATLSFALLYNDSNLATLVLKELAPFESDMNCLQHYATLLSHCYLLKVSNSTYFGGAFEQFMCVCRVTKGKRLSS